MSWRDRLENTALEITTGDGQVYTPIWLNAIKNLNYNTEGFNFIGVDGTFVSREEQSGDQFPITLFFDGDNCVDEAEAFQISAKDKRPWKLKHPFFNNQLVQPLNLQFDYSDYNVVKITGVLWKTITTKFPEDSEDVSTTIVVRKTDLDTDTIAFVSGTILDPEIGLITPLGRAISGIEQAFNDLAQAANAAKELKDKVRVASGALQNILNDLTAFTTSLIDLINFPFLIAANVRGSIEGFKTALANLIEIFDPNDDQEAIFAEVSLTALNSAASAQFVNPGENDYETRSDVANAEDALTDLYTDSLDYFDENGYIQDIDLAFALDLIVNVSRSNLFEQAFNAKQERSIFTSKDSDPVNLAHSYFGPGDDALDEFIRINNLSLAEHLEIKKGREITYFV